MLKILSRLKIKETKASIRTLFFIFACWTALSILPDTLSGFYCRISPFLVLNAIAAAGFWNWLYLTGLFILIGCFFYKRLFCRYLCPVGFSFDIVSLISGKRTCKNIKRMPRVNVWIAIVSIAAALTGIPLFAYIDPTVIFNNFFTLMTKPVDIAVVSFFFLFPLLLALQLFQPGIWCSNICPCGGLQDMTYKVYKSLSEKKQVPENYRHSRRLLISGGLGVIAGLSIPELWANNPPLHYKPPGSANDNHFSFLCVRCGSCIKSCPSGIIVYRKQADDIRILLTPQINFEYGYCMENCTNCGAVCPSGAIKPFTIEEKRQLVIAKAKLDTINCLLRHHQECNHCMASCGYDAISIVTGDSLFDIYPEVNFDKCVGCGACFSICPEHCFVMKRH